MAIIYIKQTSCKKTKSKSASILAAEKALAQTLLRVGYKGGSKTANRSYKHDLGVVHSNVTSNKVPSNGAKKEVNTYTGNEIMGIVTTHKSNLMPVRRDNKQSAVDAASMRR